MLAPELAGSLRSPIPGSSPRRVAGDQHPEVAVQVPENSGSNPRVSVIVWARCSPQAIHGLAGAVPSGGRSARKGRGGGGLKCGAVAGPRGRSRPAEPVGGPPFIPPPRRGLAQAGPEATGRKKLVMSDLRQPGSQQRRPASGRAIGHGLAPAQTAIVLLQGRPRPHPPQWVVGVPGGEGVAGRAHSLGVGQAPGQALAAVR